MPILQKAEHFIKNVLWERSVLSIFHMHVINMLKGSQQKAMDASVGKGLLVISGLGEKYGDEHKSIF